ncbi:phage tail protein [Aneurinibacillus sp. XH2]|uniref:phage tail tape measure protein n=1 Tax=Aneurinibacillus sp. XH2 TaxID=1450761 RepID=UPI00070ABC0A|nr:phage tail tape measure protein [Aneurinibacillus sp. XH2]AMA72779.1 phage tail protein [Aneurinibacillus sp. XH2]
MAVTTTLSFQEKMSKQLASILKYLGDVIDAFDDVEDAANHVEDALNSMDDSAMQQLEQATTNAYREADRLARELDEVDREAASISSTKMRELEASAKEAAKAVDEAADSVADMEEAADGAETLAGAALGGGLAITAGLAGAAASSYEMSHSLDMLQAKVDATDQQMISMSDSVKKLYMSGLVETPTEAAEAFSRFRQLLKGTDEEIRKTAEGALALEKMSAGDLDQASIAKAANAMQMQWGTDGVKALDMITATYQRTGDKANDLLDTIWEYSPQFKEAGISAEKMMGMFIAGAEKGAFNFDKLGDAFKESFGIRLNKALDENALGALEGIFGEDKLFKMLDQIKAGGKEAESAIMAITAGIASIKDQKLQDDVLSNIFGTQYEDLGRDAVLAMMNAKPLDDFAGKSQEAIDKTKNEWIAMANEIKTAIQPIGDTVLEIAQPIAKLLADMAKGMGDFAAQHPFLTKVVVSFFMLLGVLLLIATPFLLLITIGYALQTVIGAMSVAMGGFGIASLSALWPVLAVIAAVLLLIAAGWWLYDNWNVVTQALAAGWQWVKDTAIAAFQTLMAFLVSAWEYIKSTALAALQWMVTTATTTWETIKTTAMTAFQALATFLSTIWQNIKTSFINVFTGISSWLSGWISGLFSSGQKIVTTIVDGIMSVAGKVGEAINKVFSIADKFLPHSDADKGPFSRLTDSGMAIPETMAEGVAYASNVLPDALNDAFGNVALHPNYAISGIPDIPKAQLSSINTEFVQEPYRAPTYTPSFSPSLVPSNATSSGGGSNAVGGGAVYITMTNQFHLPQLATQGADGQMDMEKTANEIAEIIAKKLQHIMAGHGTVILE